MLKQHGHYFTGNFDKPIKLEILATGAAVHVDSLTVLGFMRLGFMRLGG